MQGGHHPYLKTDWWCELLSDIRARFPRSTATRSRRPSSTTWPSSTSARWRQSSPTWCRRGSAACPAPARRSWSSACAGSSRPKKTSTERWLEVHRKVHEAGLRSSATMMFGHVETAAERIEHLARLRDLQDETGGFTAFACWTMQPEGVPEQHLYPRKATPAVYLRVQALARDLPRQHRQHPDLVRDAGAQDGPGHAALRLQRLRRHDARGERGLRRRLLPPGVDRDDRARDRARRLPAAAAQHAGTASSTSACRSRPATRGAGR